MIVIRYAESDRYKFAVHLLNLARSIDAQCSQHDAEQELHVKNAFLAQLLERVRDGHKAVVVPNLKEARLLITAPDRRQLEQARQRIRHFLVPTYATFEQETKPRTFDNSHAFQRLGAVLYPAGYYVLKSHSTFKGQVLRRLALWINLEERYPRPEHSEELPTYGRLYERFRLTLATGQWSEAEQARHIMLRFNLTSGENLLFLHIEQLALQHRWKEIWQHPDRAQLVQTRLPRVVRGALLTAFHQATLLPLEQQERWQEALATFRESLPSLGILLTGRLGLTDEPVLQVFAYQAALEQDRTTLLALMDTATSPEAHLCMQNLLALLAPQVPSISSEQAVVSRTPLSLAREALDYGNFDAARQYSEEVQERESRTVLLMQIAYHTVDISLAEAVLASYSALSADEQQRLLQRFPFVNHIRNALQQLITGTEQQVAGTKQQEQSPSPIQDWLAWFEHIEHPSLPYTELSRAILHLAESCDERFWTVTHIEQFTDRLLAITDNTQLIRQELVRDALLKIAQFFLSDQAFPRIEISVYRDLYEALYLALLATPKELQYTGQMLLRLAEAQLCYAPASCTTIFHQLEQWCGAPIPKLEAWALDVCELLLDYGMEPGILASWYQLWLTELLRFQPYQQRTNLAGWLDLGRCIPLNAQLLQSLQERLSERQRTPDPIKLLPEGYRIGIYTLRESSAQRAREQMLERNSTLNISICADKVLTETAKSTAQHSDMIVLVIAAVKHAVVYGVVPLIDPAKVVRPQSSGATSLVRAVEEYAAKHFL